MSDSRRIENIDLELQYDITDNTETTIVPTSGVKRAILTGLSISGLSEQILTLTVGGTVKRRFYLPANTPPAELIPDGYITAGAPGEAITITSNLASHATSVTARFIYA